MCQSPGLATSCIEDGRAGEVQGNEGRDRLWSPQ